MAGTASARFLSVVGVGNAEEHVRRLLDRVLAALPPGFRAFEPPGTKERSNLLFLTGENEKRTAEAYQRLGKSGVSVGWREGAIRVSPFVYNDNGDIDRLLEGLAG